MSLFDQSRSDFEKLNGCKYIATIASFINIDIKNVAQIKNVVEFTIRKIDDRSVQTIVANTLSIIMKKIDRLDNLKTE